MPHPHQLHSSAPHLPQIMEYTAAGIIATLKEGSTDRAIIGAWIANCTDPSGLIQVLPKALINEDDWITNELQMVILSLPAFAGSKVNLPRDVDRLRQWKTHDDSEPAGKRARFA